MPTGWSWIPACTLAGEDIFAVYGEPGASGNVRVRNVQQGSISTYHLLPPIEGAHHDWFAQRQIRPTSGMLKVLVPKHLRMSSAAWVLLTNWL